MDTERSSNLARIRDNQRRSRQRRKEYLQELETKYRSCEQTGAEASAEIQSVARKVADENKRLRQLLRLQGLSDIDINTLSSTDATEYAAVDELEVMLGSRKICGGKKCSDERRAAALRCIAVCRSVLSGWDDGGQCAFEGPTKPEGMMNGAYASVPSSQPTPSAPLCSVDPALPYGANAGYLNSQHVSDPYAAQSLPDHMGTNSCYLGSDAVRSMRPGLGRDLEQELACQDGVEGAVPNSLLFQAMDRYPTNR